MLYGPEKGVPTDITTVGRFGLPSLGFTAELLAAIAALLATLGDSWRYATARPILSYVPLLSHPSSPSPMDAANEVKTWCSLADCQDRQGKVLRFPRFRIPDVRINDDLKHLAYIPFLVA